MHRVTAMVVSALLMTGCGAGQRLTLGERSEYIVGSAPDRYEFPLVRVTRGLPTPAGTPYCVTIESAGGEVTAIDSTGAEHAPTSRDGECWVFVMPPGTVLAELTLGDAR